MISPTRDEWFQTDTADREANASRREMCDWCHDDVPSCEGDLFDGAMIERPNEDVFLCFECHDRIAPCDECNRTVAKCSCGVSIAHEYQPEDDYDPSDGDYDWSDCAEE